MTDQQQQPFVRLPDRPLCKTHYQALIPEHHPTGVLWQTRYTIAMVEFTQLALADARVLKQCDGQLERATAILAQCVPICCFLGPEACAKVSAVIEEKAQQVRQRLGERA